MAKILNILSWSNGHLTLEGIQSYNKGNLSDLDMHKAERHIMNCDLCADALEGYGQKTGDPKVRKNLEKLRHQIGQKSDGKSKSKSNWPIIGIAASIVLLLGIGYYVIQGPYLDSKQEPEVALRKETPSAAKSVQEEIDQPSPADLIGNADQVQENQEPLPPPIETDNTLEAQNQSIQGGEVESESALTTLSNQEVGQEDVDLDAGLGAPGQTTPSADLADLAPEPAEEERQTEIESMEEEDLKEAKKVAVDKARSSAVEGGPELSVSSGLTSGAKLGGSIMDSDPEPEIGFADYETYLKEQLQFPEEARLNNISGIVKLSFTIKPGSLYSKFKVIDGLGYGCDEEAERLVKEGPNWKPAIRKGIVTKEDVIIEVRFEP